MSSEELTASLVQYENQLEQVKLAIQVSNESDEIDNLRSLREDLEQLISLTKENLNSLNQSHGKETDSGSSTLDDEYANFMAQMSEVGAVSKSENDSSTDNKNLKDDFKSLENMKCQAPYNHQLSGVSYHNALVCGVVSDEEQSFEDIMVRIMFTNPIYQEMLPCPYFLEGECKFSDEKCRFSHGELVSLASLQEYKEPDFSKMKPDDRVLVKLPTSKLWQLATIKLIGDNNTCTIRNDANKQDYEVNWENIFPLNYTNIENSDDSSDSSAGSDIEYDENVIQQSLTNQPPSQALGSWEQYTKGIGSKLLQKMGYVVGTGLGLKSDGRIEPVDAVLLPSGKSLDHCMELREKAGGDVNFFKVEKKLKRLQKKQEERNRRAYEREQAKTDVFTFLNDTLKHNKNTIKHAKDDPARAGFSKSTHRRSIQAESSKELNVNSIKIDENIKRCELELVKIRQALERHSDTNSIMNRNLKSRLMNKQMELDNLRVCERNIQTEQSLRRDQKKLTIF
ncbi:zinc finger CCCH-type with G patch domain-containing protein [Chrysoperla carnea]|uniref:zinc finger CCCH-type with G patch domain-containing protein n=1 Tax=Chrysoperla carnea TaxID=189513 RepID=UPI001D073955|nr:zinc finger CCCH-type with G patch domain-containing protein [Chrysoperla carnea]